MLEYIQVSKTERMRKGKHVKVHSRLTIVPSRPTPSGKVHPLSTLDQSMQLHRAHSTFYYAGASALKERGKLIYALMESLCEVLSVYPILAGRLRLCALPGNAKSWEVICNDAGVRVYEAAANINLQEWLQSPDESEICTVEVIPDHTLSPLFVVQLTDFKCGGVAIGLSWVHMVADPFTVSFFMKSWGETHRTMPIMHPPIFHHSLLEPRQSSNSSTRSANYYNTTFLDPSPDTFGPSVAQVKYSTQAFKFSSAAIEHLLSEFQNGSHGYNGIILSPFEALAGLFWSIVGKTQAKSGAAMEFWGVSLCLEARTMHHPPLIPNGYFGNALLFVGTATNMGKPLSGDFSYAARLVNRTLNMVKLNEEEIRSVVDTLGVGLGVKPPLFYGPELTIAKWDHFLSYEAEYGFGKPTYVAYSVEPLRGKGFIGVFSSAEGNSSRNVIITLPPDLLSSLYHDETLEKLLSL